jgi:hypothetical protein
VFDLLEGISTAEFSSQTLVYCDQFSTLLSHYLRAEQQRCCHYLGGRSFLHKEIYDQYISVLVLLYSILRAVSFPMHG